MIHIVVPMTDDGRQFQERGYALPKPLVEVAGQPLIEIVVRNLTPRGAHQFVFLCRHAHMAGGALGDLLRDIAPDCRVLPMRRPTASALCNVLLGLDQLQDDSELLIAHADQWIDESIDRFLTAAREADMDGCIMTLGGTPMNGLNAGAGGAAVIATAQSPIDPHATTGLYYFRRSADFLEAAEQMLLRDPVVVDGFYVTPVFSELVRAGRRVGTFDLHRSRMYHLATPQDVEQFQARLFADVA